MEEQQQDENSIEVRFRTLIQSVPTRWNSELDMLERLVEELDVVEAALKVLKKSDLFLKKEQVVLSKHLIQLLKPFREATKKLSHSDTTAADIIPIIETLKLGLRLGLNSSEYLRSCREVMLAGLVKRIKELISDPNCYMATALDPRYRMAPFEGNDSLKILVKSELVKECVAQILESEPEREAEDMDVADREDLQLASESEEMDFGGLMNKMMAKAQTGQQDSDINARASKEVDDYFSEKVAANTHTMDFWRMKHEAYPNLSKMARKYLSPPATSVASERLFSLSGNVCTDKRTRLLPELLE